MKRLTARSDATKRPIKVVISFAFLLSLITFWRMEGKVNRMKPGKPIRDEMLWRMSLYGELVDLFLSSIGGGCQSSILIVDVA